MKGENQRTVIHVDDEPAMARIVKKKLESAGFHVISINDPHEVLGVLLETDCHVAVLDIDMPSLNGLDLLKQIKQQDGGVQVVMLTGVVTMSTVLRSLRWGAEACVFKPFTDGSELFEALETCFEKIDRWWKTLEELKSRKNEECGSLATTAD